MIYQVKRSLMEVFNIFREDKPVPSRIIFNDFTLSVLMFNDEQHKSFMSITVRIYNGQGINLGSADLFMRKDIAKSTFFIGECSPYPFMPEMDKIRYEPIIRKTPTGRQIGCRYIKRFKVSNEREFIDLLHEWDSLLCDYEENR